MLCAPFPPSLGHDVPSVHKVSLCQPSSNLSLTIQRRIDSCPRGESTVLCSLQLAALLQEKLWETHASVFLKRGWVFQKQRSLPGTEAMPHTHRANLQTCKVWNASDPSKGTLWLSRLQPLLKENERQGSSIAELGMARVTNTEVAGWGQKLQISSQGWNWGQVSWVWWRTNNPELS